MPTISIDVADSAKSDAKWDDLCQYVIDDKERKHKRSKRTKPYKAGLYGTIKPLFAGRRAADITTEEIKQVLSDETEPSTFNNKRNAIHHVFKVAIDNAKLVLNPATAVKMDKPKTAHVRFLGQYSPDEEKRLRGAIREIAPAREPEFDLSLFTGMRWDEQYSLKWRDVDRAFTKITLLQTKSGEKQYVPINSAARAALVKLRELYPDSELVCPGNGYYNLHLRKFWKPVLKRAKITDFRWHDLRQHADSRIMPSPFQIHRLEGIEPCSHSA